MNATWTWFHITCPRCPATFSIPGTFTATGIQFSTEQVITHWRHTHRHPRIKPNRTRTHRRRR